MEQNMNRLLEVQRSDLYEETCGERFLVPEVVIMTGQPTPP